MRFGCALLCLFFWTTASFLLGLFFTHSSEVRHGHPFQSNRILPYPQDHRQTVEERPKLLRGLVMSRRDFLPSNSKSRFSETKSRLSDNSSRQHRILGIPSKATPPHKYRPSRHPDDIPVPSTRPIHRIPKLPKRNDRLSFSRSPSVNEDPLTSRRPERTVDRNPRLDGDYWKHSAAETGREEGATVRSSGYTIVTGLFDIGRGEWWLYRRPYYIYLRFLSSILRLEENMIIFIQAKGVDYVRDFRGKLGLANKTKVIPMEPSQLELYRHLETATKIMADEKLNWKRRWDEGIKPHPEASSPEYNLVVNSKPFLLTAAIRQDPFNSSFFYWFDSGYGHGEDIFPKDNRWCPSQLISQDKSKERITIIQLVPEPYYEKQTIDDLYRQDKALVSGGFFGGSKERVIELYLRYNDLFTQLLSKGYIDDDQTVMVLLMGRYPDLFNPVHGDWFDGLKFAGRCV